MKTSSAKQKGRLHQQTVRDDILKTFKTMGLEPDDVRSTAMGQGGEDIQLSPFARQFFPFSVECKRNKSFAIYNQYNQAEANCPKDIEPLLIIRGDRKKALAVVDWGYFLKLVSKVKDFTDE